MAGTDGPIQAAPGDILYLLTYQGEGFTKAWFKGRLYTDVDVTDFLSGACAGASPRCAGTLIERPRSEWWVRVRSRRGNEGWSARPRSSMERCYRISLKPNQDPAG